MNPAGGGVRGRAGGGCGGEGVCAVPSHGAGASTRGVGTIAAGNGHITPSRFQPRLCLHKAHPPPQRTAAAPMQRPLASGPVARASRQPRVAFSRSPGAALRRGATISRTTARAAVWDDSMTLADLAGAASLRPHAPHVAHAAHAENVSDLGLRGNSSGSHQRQLLSASTYIRDR